jgi:hypothetical protein
MGNLKAFRVCSYGFPKRWAFRSYINISILLMCNPQNNPIAKIEILAVINFMAIAVMPLHKQPQKPFSVRP